MLLVAFLLGGAFWWGLYQWLGQPVVVAVGLVAVLLVATAAGADVWRGIQDRRTATTRLRRMRENDALNRILGVRRG